MELMAASSTMESLPEVPVHSAINSIVDEAAHKLRTELMELMAECTGTSGKDSEHFRRTTMYANTEEQLPPSMLCSMTTKTMAAEKFLEEMDWKRAEEAKAKLAIRKARRNSSSSASNKAFQGQGYHLHTHPESPAETPGGMDTQ